MAILASLVDAGEDARQELVLLVAAVVGPVVSAAATRGSEKV